MQAGVTLEMVATFADRAWMESPVPAFVWRREGDEFRLTQHNEAAVRLSQGAVAHFVGRTLDEVYGERPDVPELVRGCASSGQTLERELDYDARGTRAKLRIRFRALALDADRVLLYASPLSPADPALARATKAAESLRDHAGRTLLEKGHACLYVWRIETDSDFTLTDYNQPSVEFTSGRVIQLLGLRARSLYWDQPKLIALFERARDEGRAELDDLELRFVTSGEIHHFEVLAIREDDHLFVFAEDRSRERAIEADLAQARTRLQQAERLDSIGRLASGIAHDFNNILGAIITIAELLLDDVPAEHAPMIQQLLTISERGTALTTQLLAFARRQPVTPRAFSLPGLLETLVPLLQRLLGTRVPIELDCVRGVPDVFADPTGIEQVVVNLAVNARDAMPEGGVLRIAVAPARPDELDALSPPLAGDLPYLALRVCDEGEGIPAELLDSIFEPFVTSKNEDRGVGLGLATVLAVVSRVGGRIAVSSTPGVGTTFTIFLPTAPIETTRSM